MTDQIEEMMLIGKKTEANKRWKLRKKKENTGLGKKKKEIIRGI